MKQYLIRAYTWVWAESEQEAVDKLTDAIVIVKVDKVVEMPPVPSVSPRISAKVGDEK